jgi:hypothetical protein
MRLNTTLHESSDFLLHAPILALEWLAAASDAVQVGSRRSRPEQRPLTRELKGTNLLGECASERTFLMPKQFAFEQRGGNGRTVEFVTKESLLRALRS